MLLIYPEKLKTYAHTKTCTWTFTEALFIIAQTLKLPRPPSWGDGQLNYVSAQWNIIYQQQE